MNKKELIDKQELIDELAKYVKSYENAMDEHGQGRYGAYEVSLKLVKRLNESKVTDEQAWNKVAEAYPESAQSLRNTLDNAVFGKTGEHQKPVVPKFVAEWFEDNKHALDLAIFTAIRELDGKEWPHETDFENWLDNAENNPIETLIRMKDGYEIEKSKWVVNEGDLVIRKGEHEAKVYFVESVDDDGILLVNGIKDEFFTDLYDRSVGEESINYFYENFRLLAKKENLEAEKVGAHLQNWNEDIGNVLWWDFPVEEPPYCGTPLDEHFPKYKTHFTTIDMPNEIEFVDEFRYYSIGDEIFDITKSSWTSDKEDAYSFTEKEKAEAVALLVDCWARSKTM